MKTLYQLFLLLFLSVVAASAQTHVFTNLAPYSQNFDGMGTVAGYNNSPITAASVLGITTGYVTAGQSTFNQITAGSTNDGSNSVPYVYNFGTNGATDRALGGIAGAFTGRGYIAARLVNRTGGSIKNFDVRYAFEQWYNSMIATDARFHVYYRIYPSGGTGFANNDLVQIVDTAHYTNWTRAANLDLAAPATGTHLGQCNGNSATYRRSKQYRISNVNLPDQAEIVFCFEYTFSPTNNGNGMAIDDIVIYPENNILYSKTTGNLNDPATWGTAADGSIPPANPNFAADNYVYFVQGNNTASRIGSGGWQITGANSRVVVGADPSAPTALTLAAGDVVGTAANPLTVDVTSNSTLTIADPLSPLAAPRSYLALGTLGTNSTVAYTGTGAQQVLPATYATLTLAGGAKLLAGSVAVGKALGLGQSLELGDYNLTLLRGASLTRGSNAQIVTNGLGELRATVIGAGSSSVPVVFPVTTASDRGNNYPVSITAGSTDRDETYRVRIIDNVYPAYDLSGVPSGRASASTSNVNKTWLIGHETTNHVSSAIELSWPAAAQGSTFRPAQAYLAHYDVSGGTGWETSFTNSLGAFAKDLQAAVKRLNVSDFSPFSVSSGTQGPLPVQLLSFEAQRVGTAVACRWMTTSELNNAYFEVERSLDGATFGTLGRVAGSGSTTQAHTYTFADARPAATLAYYRLRQVDLDGTTTYSATVAVAGGAGAGPSLAVAPNPSTGLFGLQATVEAATLVRGQVLNLLGQPILTLSELLPAGTSVVPLDLSAQPAGVYLLRLTSSAGPVTLRLQKQ